MCAIRADHFKCLFKGNGCGSCRNSFKLHWHRTDYFVVFILYQYQQGTYMVDMVYNIIPKMTWHNNGWTWLNWSLYILNSRLCSDSAVWWRRKATLVFFHNIICLNCNIVSDSLILFSSAVTKGQRSWCVDWVLCCDQRSPELMGWLGELDAPPWPRVSANLIGLLGEPSSSVHRGVSSFT